MVFFVLHITKYLDFGVLWHLLCMVLHVHYMITPMASVQLLFTASNECLLCQY